MNKYKKFIYQAKQDDVAINVKTILKEREYAIGEMERLRQRCENLEDALTHLYGWIACALDLADSDIKDEHGLIDF